MEITVIHGQLHKGSTYNITKKIIENLNVDENNINEFFLPRDMSKFCVGCYQCFYKGEDKCIASNEVQKIVKVMEKSQVIIIDSPTYCFGMTGQLKTFFDHLGYMWFPHRPNPNMFNKIGVVISTTAGAGAKKTVKDIKTQLNWIGISKVFKYGKVVTANNYDEVPEKIKEEIKRDTQKIANNIKKKNGIGKKSFKTKFMFNIMKMMQKNNTWNKLDREHWVKNGWLKK